MAQDFWASSGFRKLAREAGGLKPTPEWLAGFLEREELRPPPDAGPGERALHERLVADPAAPMDAEALAAVEDADARENWAQYLRFRDRVLAAPTLEACYAGVFRGGEVDIAPFFVDALAQAIVRGLLEGEADAWLLRAGELFFRRQRVAVEGGRVLAADAVTIQMYAETGGFGNVGRLLRSQDALPEVRMDVLNAENAPFYFLRDELYGFALDLAPGGAGAAALARVLERWVRHLVGVEVAIQPRERITDERWRWHVGLDVDSTAILNSLYRGEPLAGEASERLVLLFELAFRDPADARPEMEGRPVYLGLACRPDRTLKMKPQNLLGNLPLARPA